MVVVDLQELEEQALLAVDSIAGVVLEPDAILLLVNEIRRLKAQITTQHESLAGMKTELTQLHNLLTEAIKLGSLPHRTANASQKRKSKVFSMRVRPGAALPGEK